MIDPNIRIGLPSLHSRLHKKVMQALDLQINCDPRLLIHRTAAVTVFFLRPWDIPHMVASDRLDYAFCGLDTMLENNLNLPIISAFEESASRLAFCARDSAYPSREHLLTVATEYVRLTEDFLSARGHRFELLEICGAAEAYPSLNGINAIVDIVESGATLRANGLRIVDVICHTYPCLVGRGALLGDSGWSFDSIRNHIAEALVGSERSGSIYNQRI